MHEISKLVSSEIFFLHSFRYRYGGGVVSFLTRKAEDFEGIEDCLNGGDDDAFWVERGLTNLPWFLIAFGDNLIDSLERLETKLKEISPALIDSAISHNSGNSHEPVAMCWLTMYELVGNIIAKKNRCIDLSSFKHIDDETMNKMFEARDNLDTSKLRVKETLILNSLITEDDLATACVERGLADPRLEA